MITYALTSFYKLNILYCHNHPVACAFIFVRFKDLAELLINSLINKTWVREGTYEKDNGQLGINSFMP